MKVVINNISKSSLFLVAFLVLATVSVSAQSVNSGLSSFFLNLFNPNVGVGVQGNCFVRPDYNQFMNQVTYNQVCDPQWFITGMQNGPTTYNLSLIHI